jgi:hypothetical protein
MLASLLPASTTICPLLAATVVELEDAELADVALEDAALDDTELEGAELEDEAPLGTAASACEAVLPEPLPLPPQADSPMHESASNGSMMGR